MKNFYYAVDVMRDRKHYPYVIDVPEGANLLANINRQETDVILPCSTRKEAIEVIEKEPDEKEKLKEENKTLKEDNSSCLLFVLYDK